jgi:hypothetical protein
MKFTNIIRHFVLMYMNCVPVLIHWEYMLVFHYVTKFKSWIWWNLSFFCDSLQSVACTLTSLLQLEWGYY